MVKLLVGLFIAFIGAGSYVAYEASNGHNSNNNSGGSSGLHGAPGPLAGAGLPFLAVGYGAYWLYRRRKANQRAD